MANDRGTKPEGEVKSERELQQNPVPDHDSPVETEDDIRRLLDEQRGDPDIFNPRTGEDPGLLPLTEDPQERRLKRTTM